MAHRKVHNLLAVLMASSILAFDNNFFCDVVGFYLICIATMTLWCPFSLFSSWLAGLFYLSFLSLCSNSSPSFSNVLLSVEPLAQKLDRTPIVWFGPGLNLSFFCLGLPFWSCLHARCFFGKFKLKKERVRRRGSK